ncbi:MAG: TRAP transporter small permease [Desulfobacterales bacterium]|nr:TRAP transporter small permease [Desulfobacterales bacterium]
MGFLDKINQFLNRLLTFIGGFFLVAMVLLTCANIFSRNIWVPIKGTFELMGYFGAIVTAFALGYTQLNKGHIAVDVLINTFSEKTRNILQILNNGVCAAFFGIAAWQIAVKATTLMNTGEITETLRIIYYPFTFAVAFGCLVLALVMLTDLLKFLIPHKEPES